MRLVFLLALAACPPQGELPPEEKVEEAPPKTPAPPPIDLESSERPPHVEPESPALSDPPPEEPQPEPPADEPVQDPPQNE